MSRKAKADKAYIQKLQRKYRGIFAEELLSKGDFGKGAAGYEQKLNIIDYWMDWANDKMENLMSEGVDCVMGKAQSSLFDVIGELEDLRMYYEDKFYA